MNPPGSNVASLSLQCKQTPTHVFSCILAGYRRPTEISLPALPGASSPGKTADRGAEEHDPPEENVGRVQGGNRHCRRTYITGRHCIREKHKHGVQP